VTETVPVDHIFRINGLRPVRTTRSGHRYYLCPVHTEKTPSMVVLTRENWAYCLGCQTGIGNAIDAVQELEKVNFRKAVIRLWRLLGLKKADLFKYGKRKNLGGCRKRDQKIAEAVQRLNFGA